jgi:hypothetical protein
MLTYLKITPQCLAVFINRKMEGHSIQRDRINEQRYSCIYKVNGEINIEC